jgi:hypothetical protein
MNATYQYGYGYLGSRITKDIYGETYRLATFNSSLIAFSAKIPSPSKFYHGKVSSKFCIKELLGEFSGYEFPDNLHVNK